MSDIQEKIDAYTSQCNGSDKLWIWWLNGKSRKFFYTDGVKLVSETCGAYWLIDTILLNQRLPEAKAEEFQVWKLAVVDSSGILTCEDGNGRQTVYQFITFTDFPIPEMTFWFEIDALMLPCER